MPTLPRFADSLEYDFDVLIVIGANSKIVRECYPFLTKITRLILVDVDRDELADIQNSLRNTHPEGVFVLPCLEFYASPTLAIQKLGRIDLKHQTFGVIYASAFTGEILKANRITAPKTGSAKPEDIFDVNVVKFQYAINDLFNSDVHLTSVVAISSIYAQKTIDRRLYDGTSMVNPIEYGASKAAMDQSIRWLAGFYAERCRFNSVVAGGVLRNQPETFVERYKSKTSLGRMATESEVAVAICFLLSNTASYITGHSLACDGGFL